MGKAEEAAAAEKDKETKEAEEKAEVDAELAREEKLETDALRMIVELIVNKKPDLYWYFTQGDKERTGHCSRLEWQQVMLNVLGVELPYLQLQPKLADTDADGKINYTEFLERYRIEMRPEDMKWQATVIETVCRRIFSTCSNLKEAFQVFDVNDDGTIEYEEFLETLKGLKLGLTDQQIFELMRSIDENANATIDFTEFSQRFRVTFNEMKLKEGTTMRQASADGKVGDGGGGAAGGGAGSSSGDKEIHAEDREVLKQVGEAIFKHLESIDNAFARFDANGDGALSVEEFANALSELGVGCDQEQRLFNIVDANDSGRISYVEFVAAFQVEDSRGDAKDGDWRDHVVQQVANVLFQHRIQLRSAFRMFDLDNDGQISGDEFQAGLRAINALLDPPLSTDQIDALRGALDRNGDGSVDYKEFLEGFQIVDTIHGGEPGRLRQPSL
eukprot:g3484.t1